jgi:hypothetical protein
MAIVDSLLRHSSPNVPTTTTTDNTSGIVYPTTTAPIDYQELLRQQQQAAMDLAMREQILRDLMKERQKPFEETEEFRDFVVWLCGFTERHDPPGKKDWENLRNKTKKIAAKFALAAKDRAAEEWKGRSAAQPDLFSGYAQTSTIGQALSTSMDEACMSAMATGTTTTFSTGADKNG